MRKHYAMGATAVVLCAFISLPTDLAAQQGDTQLLLREIRALKEQVAELEILKNRIHELEALLSAQAGRGGRRPEGCRDEHRLSGFGRRRACQLSLSGLEQSQ